MLKGQHQPLIPCSFLRSGLQILPGWEEKLEDVTQVQPLQSLTEQCREAQAALGPASPQTNMAEDCTQLAMGALQVPLQKADSCQ